MTKVHEIPSDICAESGHVLVSGPGGMVCSMTAGAAAETSERLLHAAAMATGQLIVEHQRKQDERDARRT